MELSINKHIVDLIHKHHLTKKWNIAQARPMSVVLRVTQLAKLSFNHPSAVLTADVFRFFFCKIAKLRSCEIEKLYNFKVAP